MIHHIFNHNKRTIIIVLFVTIIVLYALYMRKNTEGFNNLQKISTAPNFYIKHNRHLIPKIAKTCGTIPHFRFGTIDDCPNNNNPCKECNWYPGQTPGANGTCTDLMWHVTSPRNILKDNSMKCNEVRKHYMTPNGVQGNFATRYPIKGNIPLEDNINTDYMISNNFSIPDISNSTMSYPMSNGIVPMQCDCVNHKANNYISHGCGCNK